MRRFLGAVILAAHLSLGVAAAQTVSATMGAIDGRVTDNTNAVLAGVTVTISGPAMMGTRIATTNEEGVYRLAAVPPGTYTVVFELDGFSPLTRAEIRVSLGFTVTLNVQMALAGVAENVTVTGGSPVVDTASTKITTTFDASMLATLPSGSRDYWSVLSETPALKLTRIDVGGSSAGSQSNYYAYGTTGQNRPMIEGINSTQGTERFGNYVDMGSFDEIAVNAAAHTAEMAVPGIQMVFIGKSGGNAYHGSLVGHFATERLAVVQHRRSSNPPRGHRRRRACAPRREPAPPVSRHQRRYRRLRRQGPPLVVRRGSRSGNGNQGDQLPGQAVRHTFDQLHGEGHLHADHEQQTHRVHRAQRQAPAEPPGRLRARTERDLFVRRCLVQSVPVPALVQG